MDYTYGKLEDEIVNIFKQKNPDFQRAKELILLGANLNAKSIKDDSQDDNMLEEILLSFWETCCDKYGTCKRRSCIGCNESLSDEEVGNNMLSVIKFFLDNGFDVSANNNRQGAQCLYALTLSTHNKYILPCAKLLLDAGAKDIVFFSDDSETVSDSVCFDSFFQSSEGRQDFANILEAYYQILMAANDGRNYHNIDAFDAAYGKKITKVVALPEKEGPFFYDVTLPDKTYHNCYNGNLHFVYEGGSLVNTQYAEIWVDASEIPQNAIDVSAIFKDLCGAKISDITFDQIHIMKGVHGYTQPIIYIHMDNGVTFKTTINFGEVTDNQEAAYYEMITE